MNEKIQNFFFNCENCVLENPRKFYGCFTLGPFKNSQGLTVANALRRTLLSELRGIAITHLNIDGVIHEYTTLVGVRESVLDILLNFKHIVLKNTFPLKKPLLGYLNVRGPGVVRASDLKLPSIIQCVDPDQYIATLTEKGQLSLKFTISDFQNYIQRNEILDNFFIPEYKNNEHLNFQISKDQLKDLSLKSLKIGNLEQVYSQQTNTSLEKKKFLEQKLSSSLFLYNHPLNRLKQKRGLKDKRNFFFLNQNFETQINRPNERKLSKIANKIASWQFRKKLMTKQNKKIFGKFSSKTFPTSQKLLDKIQPTVHSLWIDPLFNPILKVNYLIETIQPIQSKIPNQRIRVEFWTNGSIHPRKAFYDSLTYLNTMFNKLESMKYLNYKFLTNLLESENTINRLFKTFQYDFDFYNSLEKKNSIPALTENYFIPKEIQQIEKYYSLELVNNSYKNLFEIPVQGLSLPSRLKNILIKNQFFVIGDILKYSPNELKTFPGIGNSSISLIQKNLSKIGLKFQPKKSK